MLRIKDSDSENLVKLLDDLEFRTIKNRMVSQGIIHEKKNEQLSFFDSDIKKKEKLNVSYEIVDADHIDQFVKKILLSDELCIDTETSSLNIEEAEIAGIAFSNKEYYAYYVPTIKDRQEIINKLKPVFESKSIKFIGHNLKYDLQILKKYGIEAPINIFDTMIAHYLINPETSHKLDVLSENYLNHKCIPIEDIIGKKGIFQKKNDRD